MPAKNDPVITADDATLKKVLSDKTPAAILLLDGIGSAKPLEDALKREAKKRGDDLLPVKVDASANPSARKQYGSPELPAIVTLQKGGLFGRKVLSSVENVRPADLRAHIAHLVDGTPLPSDEPAADTSSEKKAKEFAIHATDKSFRKTVLKSKTPVLVDFWAEWCGPCRAVAPFVEEMAQKYKGRVKVVKLNTDQNQATAGEFGIQSIPTFMMFVDGEMIERRSGASPNLIRDMIEEALLTQEA